MNLVLTSLRHYAQDVTQRELRHFSVMVDGDGDGRAARCKLDPSLKATCFQHSNLRVHSFHYGTFNLNLVF